MAESSSHTTEAISIPVLKNQSSNLVLRNDLSLYPAPIAALVECLKKSVLGHALTFTPIVPATLVHRAHYTSNALFDANNQVKSVFYEIVDNDGNTKKVQLTKEKFAEALHLPIYNSKEMVVPSADQLVAMFNEMGYEPQLEKISNFKKPQLPDLWRYFFSIFLRCLSGRTSGLDSASVAFHGLLYGIYYDVKVDFASILWADFCSHINHSLKGTEISNARFWSIVVHAQYQKSGYVPDPSLTEMRFTPVAIPTLDEVPAAFCAQIPEGMLSKVTDDCIEVRAYRAALTIPYPTRGLALAEPQVPTKMLTRAKGKKKAAGGSSATKRAEKKRKASEHTPPKRKPQKKSRKLITRDESSESEKVISEAIPDPEEDETQTSPIREAGPPSPPPSKTLPHPPKTTQPLTPPPPPTTAPLTSSIPTASSEVVPSSPPKTSSIPVPPISTAPDSFLDIPDPDTSLPDFPFQEDFDFETTTFTKPPTTEETMAIFHMAPIAMEEADEEGLDDSDFILGKQYKILNRKLDALLQSSTGFDPTKKPEASVEEQIAEAQNALLSKMETLIQASEKKVLAQQLATQRVLEAKLNTAVEQVEERHRLLAKETEKKVAEFVKSIELSNLEVKQALFDLRDKTDSFNRQYQTGFAKHLSDAHKRVEDLTAELSSSTLATFSNELRTTNQTLVSDMVDKLKIALQPMLKLSVKLDKAQAARPRPQLTAQGEQNVHPSQGGESEIPGSQAQAGETPASEAGNTPASEAGKTHVSEASVPPTSEATTTTTTTQQQQQSTLGRPAFIPAIPGKADPSFGTTTTTEIGGSSSQPLRREIRIAPSMEQVNRDREVEFHKILAINKIAIDNHTWTEELIKSIGFNDFFVNNRLPLKSMDTRDTVDQQLDLPYNPKTFAFLQFERKVPEDKLPEFKARKVAFHAKYIQAPNYVWSEKKIVKIISIKKGEVFVGFQNLNFFCLRGSQDEEFRFTIADFPIMNPSDIISLLNILRNSSGNECEDMGVFASAKQHLASFFRNYLQRLARVDITVAALFNQSLAPPPTTIENFEDLKAGQIVPKPWGVVFKGLSNDSETLVTKFFEIDFLGRYPSESIKQVLALVNNCFVNTWQEKKVLREHLNWWLTVRYTLKQAFNKHLAPQRR
ncbi:hypothetical protein L1887_17970 [Cichorium endivia]|nr:hypothetical protein L1887_17970 [Cichorium endivia]